MTGTINTRHSERGPEMAMNTTSITLTRKTRDSVKQYRDAEGHPNYDAAVSALLEEVDAEQ